MNNKQKEEKEMGCCNYGGDYGVSCCRLYKQRGFAEKGNSLRLGRRAAKHSG